MEVGDVLIVADYWTASAVVEKALMAAVAGHTEGFGWDMEGCLCNDGDRYCHCCQLGTVVVGLVATVVAGDYGCYDDDV